MKIKHVLASQKDKKPTINDSDLKSHIPSYANEILLFYSDGNNEPITTVEFHRSRNGKTWYPTNNWIKNYPLPKIGKPVFLEVIAFTPIHKPTLFV